MNFQLLAKKISQQSGVALSTMMKTPCLRYKGEFMAMFFEKEDALIIKVAAERVNQLIEQGRGMEFNFTKKRFKEWVLIPLEFEDEYENFIEESWQYAKNKKQQK